MIHDILVVVLIAVIVMGLVTICYMLNELRKLK